MRISDWSSDVCSSDLVALYAAWPSDEETIDQRDRALAGAAQEEATADQFVEAFRANEAAAGERFRDKALWITGKVAGVRERNSEEMVIRCVTQTGDPMAA